MSSPTNSSSEFFKLREPLEFKHLRSYVESRCKYLSEELKERGGITDEDLDKIDELIKRIGKRVEVLISKYNNTENRTRNSMVCNLWDKIYPIGLCDPHDVHGSSFKVPYKFPNNLTEFWRLKENLSILTVQLQFYETTGWESWGKAHKLDKDCKNDTEDDQPQLATLEAAVAQYPETALGELAKHLGLNFCKIRKPIANDFEPKKAEKRLGKRNAQSEVGKIKAKTQRLEGRTSVKTSLTASSSNCQLPIRIFEDHPKERTYIMPLDTEKVKRNTSISSHNLLSSSVSQQEDDEIESNGQTLSENSGDKTGRYMYQEAVEK